MSIHFSQGKLQGQERTSILQEVQKQAKAAALRAIKPIITAFLEAEQQAKLGREKGEPRRVRSQPREIDWQCGHCGCRDAHQFTRDGHYRRCLATGWGLLEGLQVPMVECQSCGHDVVCTFAVLEKYQRFWVDVDQRLLFGCGLCQSLRHLSQEWSATLESSVGLRTINERIHQIEPLLRQDRSEAITDVPAVVQFDGIWLARADADADHQVGQTRTQAASTQRQESGAARRVGVLDRREWQAGDSRLATRRWRKQGELGPECRIASGNEGCVRRPG